MSKIDGNRFRLMSIGIWPFKGPLASFSLAAVHGSMEESSGGSTIRGQYTRGPQCLVFLLTFGFSGLVFTLLPIVLFLFQLEGQRVFGAVGFFWDLVVLWLFLYSYRGVGTEAKFIGNCLDELVDRMTTGTQATKNGD